MQVDPTLMNVGDGGTVSREISAPNKASTSMVGNPPQTLPPEFRGDVTLSQQNKTTPTKDCKTVKACLDSSNCNHSVELSPPQPPNNAPTSSSDKRTDKRAEAPKLKADGAGVFPAPQWSGALKAGREDALNPCHSNVTPSKKSHPQTQPKQSASSGFQRPAMFKQAPPVAFLPSSNFNSSLCKITLPPALGQIAALRDASTAQFQKEIPPQSSGVGAAPLLRTYPYSLSAGRTPAADKKTGTSTPKPKSNHSSTKTAIPAGDHKSLASVVASPATALPLQRPSLTSAAPTHYTLSPTAAICCGSALASITSQSRLLNHVEKDKTAMGSLKTPPPSTPEDKPPRSVEPRDVPLDLSAKSKRLKTLSDAGVGLTEPRSVEPSQRDSLKCKRTHSTSYSSAVQYPVLQSTHSNGSHQKQLNRPQNHQIPEPKTTWGKGSAQDPIKSIPGTYVGVASPILASTLRGKDGKGTFADEFQSFAKQEFISIIDQGEHLASGGKKPSCVMKASQHAHSVKHLKTTSKNCPPKGALTTALLSPSNPQIYSKTAPGNTATPFCTSAVSPAWQQPPPLPHQASSAQKKVTQGPLKSKGATISEGCKYPSGHHCPSKNEDAKWDRMKSPLSNLASIVKQQGLESAGLGGVNEPVSSVASRKADSNPAEYQPYWSAEKWPNTPSQGDLSTATKRQDKANAAEPLENNGEKRSSQAEHVGAPAKRGSSKPAGQQHLFGNGASTNGNRMESKLAQVLEGETPRKESGALRSPPTDKLEGMVASILTGQCVRRGDKPETNGTKEESPTKTKASAVKQKKTSPKKQAKEKSAAEPSKKISAKKKLDAENGEARTSCNKKKKPCTPVLEQSLSAGKLPPPSKGRSPKDKTSPKKADQAAPVKAVPDNSATCPQSIEAPPNASAKEADAADGSFPRLRRGRRRADDARLDLWGFATPSPPPPPMPSPGPPPAPTHVSKSPPPTPAQPARRPRGRPRSNPLPERPAQGKGKTSGAEGDTPPQKKRRRCRSRKYQTGEYITEKDKLEDGEHLEEPRSPREGPGVPADSEADQCPSPAPCSPEPPPRRPSFTRSGSVRYQEGEESLEGTDKPSGKRKFKSKHLSDGDEHKNKSKRGGLSKRGTAVPLDDHDAPAKRPASPPRTPKSLPSSPSNKKSSSARSSGSDSPTKRPVPPEVRRLIVNKNAGETLLQRAARLGYQDVVQYCLEKDVGEVNRRDNAGYTALHEASSRGWTQIVQMLLKHGADVNCSSQDGTRPLHDAVASDNLPIVWLLLNHGADPTLATYSGHTPVKLAHSSSMKTFLTEYFTDLEGRNDQDPSVPWEFYSSSLFECDQEPCWDFLLSEQNQDQEDRPLWKTEPDPDRDCLVFEFSDEPLLPCYHVQMSLTQGFCNWFLLTDVLKRLKMSSRIFRARYPHLEVVSLSRAELWRQVSVSQVSSALASPRRGKNKMEEEEDEEEEGPAELVRCVPELQRLLGSSIHILQEEEEDEEDEEQTNTGKPRGR